ncbi:solute:sodium symporter family transporter [Cyclobacterium qasimii]|uniref:Sodium/myo-inositol cotransporter n=2 Tax=Cyclobacterium qasimii TaxID=1350429 RepID=S7WQ71_9BACT|nr:solute:sodium symporter family transporter [Cyclobacterium qasimii]EPR66248.1 Sodium/myo-inositol cotransporter [Cyclobacterium qasimii M12-11B]GEO20810.1 solute:sodium symporter family transporter [Cyclobacterium qasimii]
MLTAITFVGFTLFVAIFSWYKLRKDDISSRDGYFLGGRSLTGGVIAGSMILTNISTEHLIGLNGSAYKNGMIIIAWEVTSAIALVIAALYFLPIYLKMGLTTIPQYLEQRYDSTTKTIVAFLLMVSFVVTLLPIVLYTGAINLESIFNVSEVLNVSRPEGIWITVITIGVVGSIYAIFGGLKAVALSDSINAIGLLIGGLMVPTLALWDIGDGNILDGITKVYEYVPEKFDVIGKADSVLPFSTIFTGLMINQLYFWGMNQTIIQRAFGAKNMAEAQKGLLFTGVMKIFIPLIIVVPGIIAYYYYGDKYYDNQDFIYPVLLMRVMPLGLLGFFAAVVLGAILSTFNSVLNSAATIFSLDIYKKLIDTNSSDKKLVRVGRLSSLVLAVFAILIAPLVGNAPEGLYQLMQQLNGIFFIPIASILIAGFFIPRITANGAKVGLVTGLSFYLLTSFIFDSGIHFIHIWAIEFVINLLVMFAVSHYFPGKPNTFVKKPPVLEMKPWRYAKPVSLGLCIVTILIYIWLGS